MAKPSLAHPGAFKSADPAFPKRPATGRVREEAEIFLTELARTITDAPWAPLMAALVEAAERDDELRTLLSGYIEQRRAPLREILTDGVERGQVPANIDPDLLAGVLGGALFYRRLISHEPVDEAFVHQLLDLALPDRGPLESPSVANPLTSLDSLIHSRNVTG